jgi:hypothetical protein
MVITDWQFGFDRHDARASATSKLPDAFEIVLDPLARTSDIYSPIVWRPAINLHDLYLGPVLEVPFEPPPISGVHDERGEIWVGLRPFDWRCVGIVVGHGGILFTNI